MTFHHAAQIGELQPITLRPTASSSEIQILIEKHLATRPDHLLCLHPNATKAMRAHFTKWVEDHAHLRTQLGMALAEEENGWKGMNGEPTETPINWTEGKGSFTNLQSNQLKQNGYSRTLRGKK